MKKDKFPKKVPLGPCTTVWVESEIDAWVEEQIRLARGETIATAIEQADGLLGGLGGGEARNVSTSCTLGAADGAYQDPKLKV